MLISSVAAALAMVGATPAPAAGPSPKPAAEQGQVELKGLDLMVVDEHPGSATVVNRRSRTREGDIVTIDAMNLLSDARIKDGKSFNWIESEEQIDCRGHRQRGKPTYLHTLDLSSNVPLPSPKFLDWMPITPDVASFEAYMCQGVVAKTFRVVPDLASYRREYMAKAAAAPAASPPPAKAPTTTLAPYYLLVEDAEHGAMIFKAPGGYDEDGVVITSVYTLQPKPMLLQSGMTVVWGAGEMVIDCKQHRWHQVAAKMLNLERTQGIEIEGAKFDPFAPITAGTPMAKAEALLCQKRLDTGLTPVNDLTDFARQHKLPAAAQPRPVAAAPAPRAAAAPPAKPPQYRMAEVGKDGATLIDRASITRQGDVVSFRQLHMLAESGKVNGMDYWWADVSVEADCKLHRTRLRVDDFLSLDRKRREVEGTPKFNPWDAAKPGTEGRAIEDFVCRGTGEKDFEAVPDVEKLRSEVMGAIKAGVFKD